MSRNYILLLTSAIAIDGEVMKAGSEVEVSEAEAKNLLARGKAKLADVQLESAEDVDTSKMNKDQLAAIAEQLEIEGFEKMTKAQLLEAIEAVKNEGDE